MTDPNTIVASGVAVVQAAGAVMPDTVRQFDKFGNDVAKTIRLLLFPFQLTGALQDRLEKYIDRAIRQVPEDRRIEPLESIAFPIVEKLRFQPESDPITELYVQLLSRAMDGERVGEAHPAFFSIITQLAPDELLFLRDFERRDETIIMAPSGKKIYPAPEARQLRIEKAELPPELKSVVENQVFRYEALNQPEMFPVYQEHLEGLGLIQYHNWEQDVRSYFKTDRNRVELEVFIMKLTHFGRLFLKACDKEGSSSAVTPAQKKT